MKDRCVSCAVETPYDVTENINNRFYYVDGAGQLCEDCYDRVYNTQIDE